MKRFVIASAIAALALSACADNDAGENAADTVEAPEAAADDGVSANAAMDFDELALGAKIVGPVGPEVEASLATDLESIGDIKSYVACAEGNESCDPKSAAPGMVYTYVYIVTPGTDDPNDDKFPQPEAVAPVSKATGFKMVLPAVGYTGESGYSQKQAVEALGDDGAFLATCSANGLSFELVSGTEWSTGEPITFFWRSTVPPKGPMDAFILEADGKTGVGAGPSPTTRGNAGANEKAVCP